jgi:broad specificity phosphatase PhoE
VTETTVVHLMRHGEVHNPTGVLYGRIPDFHLSELGRKMADRVAEHVAGRDIVHLVSSRSSGPRRRWSRSPRRSG